MAATPRSLPSRQVHERRPAAAPAASIPQRDDPGLVWLDAVEHELRTALAAAHASVARCEQALARLVAARQWATTENDAAGTHVLDGAQPGCGRACADHRLRLALPVTPLTTRETQILELIAAGMSNRAIAEALFLSPRTVERHVANIYLKLDVHSKAEATAYAQQHHLV
jgi:DNA-binding NarL/FixJ family response regulator